MGYKIDLSGMKFGRLTVLEFAFNKSRRSYWKCKCECGNHKIIEGYKLKTGHTKSCGCLSRENFEKLKNMSIKHNLCNTRLYRAWINMKNRCYNKKLKEYKNYGGRGIKVCDEWKNDFLVFYKWSIENGYSDDLTIDRIDVNGNYEPSNCRWTTIEIQANNKTNNHFITYNNQTLTINQWARKLNIPRETIKTRLGKKYPINIVLKKGKVK